MLSLDHTTTVVRRTAAAFHKLQDGGCPLVDTKQVCESVDMSFAPEYVVLPQEPWIIGSLVAHTLLLLAVIIFRRHQRVTVAIFLSSSADL